jgi:hypothetical protein
MPNPVEQIKSEYDDLVEYLTTQQPSLLSDLNKNFRKVLLLSAGSYYENQVTNILSNFVRTKSNGDERIIKFLEKQAISGRYHQLFDWGKQDKPEDFGKNANKFFVLFGSDFKNEMETELKPKAGESSDEKLKREKIVASIEAFIEIGHLRNILVHSNFAAYNYDQKTTEEIFQLFQKAEPFLDYLKDKLS